MSPVSCWMGGADALRRAWHDPRRDPIIDTQNTTAQPADSFESFGLGEPLLRAVRAVGFTAPRPIQTGTIPATLAGRDVLGLAQTGTGKTAAFALPMLERLSATRSERTRALILAPTRELAIQIHAEIESLARYTKVTATTVFGGVRPAAQHKALRAHPDIVVACPGRLLDLMGSGHARFDGLEILVLDEADHMFDMGFLPDLRRILKQLPARRQNLLFSATMPKAIRGLVDELLTDPALVELSHSAPADTIEHALYPVGQKLKGALLRHLLSADDFTSAIVFLRTKYRARRLAKDLERDGHRAVALQGNMSQVQRQRAMAGFREGRYDVLVATDIAARGLDIAGVSHVVNFDVPDTPDAYTHRIGRTGRAERSGKAYTFATHDDFEVVAALEKALKMSIPRVKLRDFASQVDQGLAEGARPAGAATPSAGRAAGAGGRGGRGRRGGGGGRGASTGGGSGVERSAGPGAGRGGRAGPAPADRDRAAAAGADTSAGRPARRDDQPRDGQGGGAAGGSRRGRRGGAGRGRSGEAAASGGTSSAHSKNGRRRQRVRAALAAKRRGSGGRKS